MNSPSYTLQALRHGHPLMEAVYQLRHEVFVLEQDVPVELERDEYDQTALHLAALDAQGQVQGTLRVLSKGDTAKIGRVAVRASQRRRGLGSRLVQRALLEARHAGATVAALDAQLEATGLYEKLGFVRLGEVFEEAGILHISMQLPLK